MTNKRVAVVGDIMLDTLIQGPYEKIGAEAIPVIRANKVIHQLGAAANVANNLHGLENEVKLFGWVGTDEPGRTVLSMLKDINISHYVSSHSGHTTHKMRINQIMRVDHEQRSVPNAELMFHKIKDYEPELIIVSDYGKGAITQELFDSLKTLHKPILVDPKNLNYQGAFLITPNRTEAELMTGEKDTKKVIGKLKERYHTVLLTMGKEGMYLARGSERRHFPTQAKEIYDVMGAGDAVISTIAHGIIKGKSLEDSIELSNKAAGIVCGHIGQYQVKQGELDGK